MSTSSKSPWLRICYGFLALLFLAAGILFLVYPIRAEAFAGYIYVCFFTATGVMQIITYFTNRKAGVSGWILALGIIDVLVGIYFLCNAMAIITLMPFILAFWAIFTGFFRCLIALQEKGETSSWGWNLAFGALLLLIGILMFFNFASALLTVAMLLAITMFVLAGNYCVQIFTK